MNNNPHKGLHNLYLFLGIIVALIVIWQFIAARLPTSSSGPSFSQGTTSTSGSSNNATDVNCNRAPDLTADRGNNNITYHYSVDLANGCGAVVIGYSGNVDGTSWGNNNPTGKVIALGPGSHQVDIFQGAIYYTATGDSLRQLYCGTISNAHASNEADNSPNIPLDQAWTCP